MSVAKSPIARILVVDDDRDLRALLTQQLQAQGFDVVSAANGQEMRRTIAAGANPDLIILDINLPGEDGLSLCRNRSTDSPVIMLTARGDAIDRIIGLETGADDYLAKPFEPRELTARIRSVLRRARALPPNLEPLEQRVACFSGWRLDLERRLLIDPDQRVVSLSGAQFRLLDVLARHAHCVLTRDQIVGLLGGKPGDQIERSIDLQISRLRQKLGEDSRFIKTVRNEGYVLASPVEFE